MKKIFALVLLSFLLLVSNQSVGANMYGEEKNTEILINKQVKSPLDDNWYEQLDSSQVIFAAENYVEFRITIKNTGDEDLTNIKVRDELPNYITPVAYPGEYNESDRQIRWTIDKLTPDEQREFTIKAQVFKSDNLPYSDDFCLVNRVYVDTDQNRSDSDTTHFCISTRVLSEQVLPESGNPILIATAVASSLILLGIIGRKFGRGELTK